MQDGETIPVPPLSSDAPGQPLPLAAPPGEKKKRHRRTKAELEAARKADQGEQAPPPSLETDIKEATAALSVTFQALGAILGAKRGEHWKLEKAECDALGGAWAVVLAPYLARFGQAVPVVGALVVTWGVVQPRIEEDQRRKKIRAALDAPLADAAPAPVPTLVQ